MTPPATPAQLAAKAFRYAVETPGLPRRSGFVLDDRNGREQCIRFAPADGPVRQSVQQRAAEAHQAGRDVTGVWPGTLQVGRLAHPALFAWAAPAGATPQVFAVRYRRSGTLWTRRTLIGAPLQLPPTT